LRKFDRLTFGRAWPIPISVLCLAVPIFAIQLAWHEKRVPVALPLAVYGAYVIGIATTLTMIAQRLYAMHEVGRFVFDIAILFMLVGLLAMPLGMASMVANWLALVAPNSDAHEPQAWALIAAILYSLIVPVFFVTEAIMALAGFVSREIRRWTIKNG
jgi:hypothetical protein